jgi:hypothetical protein
MQVTSIKKTIFYTIEERRFGKIPPTRRKILYIIKNPIKTIRRT